MRKVARDFDKVIIEGPANSRYLYEFADEYLENEIQPGFSDEYKGRSKNHLTPDPAAKVIRPSPGHMGRPEKRALRRPFKPNPNLEWRCLAPEPEHIADVLFSFRPVKKFNGRSIADKEYPIGLCEELVSGMLETGVTVACIGGPDNYCVEGATDLRGISLERQCAALAGAQVCAGPSSGPIHLASLCKTPHVVWYNRPDQTLSIPRYRDYWNPYQTPFTYMKQQLPKPIEVIDAVKEFIR